MRIVGITGGTGSGKTTACEHISALGFRVIDFDRMARRLQEPGMPIYNSFVKEFGKSILHDDGTLNRAKYGEMIFSDKAKRAVSDELGILHMDRELTRILDEFLMNSDGVTKKGNPDDFLQKKVLFLDAPILFETKLKYTVDEAWVIDVEDEQRIKRIMERDKIDRVSIEKRIAAQMPRQEKLRRANVVIDNSGTLEGLLNNIDRALNDLYNRTEESITSLVYK